jgi:diguanylate cyclase (GGDEF)-like protein/PAS domain S-box-containing protein
MITSGQAADSARRADDRLLDNIFESIPVLIAVLDSEFRFLRVNRAYAHAHGKEPDFFPGRNHFDLCPDEQNRKIFQSVFESGEPASIAARPFESADHPERGVSRWDWTLTPLRDAQGNVVELLLALVNVSERIGTIEAARRGEAHYRHLVESSSAIPWEADGETFVFSYIGPQAEGVFGYPIESWYRPGFWAEHLHPDDRERALQLCRDATAAGRDHEFEYRLIAADGHPVWVRDSVKVVSDEGSPKRLQGFLFDISGQRQAEEELSNRRQLMQRVIEGMPIVVWAMDDNDRFTLSEGKGLESLGLRPGQVVGENVFEFYRDVPAVQDVLRRASKGEVFSAEVEVAGSVFETHQSPLRDEDGQQIGAVGVSVDITARKRAEDRLRESERELKTILDNLQDTYYRTDTEGRLELVSSSAYALVGYTPDELRGRRLAELYVDKDGREKFLRALAQGNGAVENYEDALRHRDGRIVWVATNSKYRRDAEGNVIGVEGIARNVTERRRAEEMMRQHSGALEQTADSVTICDQNGTIEYVNPAFEKTTGYLASEAIGETSRILKSGKMAPEFYEELWHTILGGDSFSDVFINRRKDGAIFYEEKTITPLKNEDGEITHFVATGKDISDRMQFQERLQQLAHHDVLTGLPNRTLFSDRLEHALALRRAEVEIVALLFLDLDRFKIINDTLGHAAGDRALQIVSDRLLKCLRKGDTVARLGGDEFAIILEDSPTAKGVGQIAQNILGELSQPLLLDGQEFFLTGSIGISLYPFDGDRGEVLLKNADIAMYRAKDRGRNTLQFYSPEMGKKAYQRLSMETSLRHALEREQLVLHYQPQVNATAGRVIAAEALLRWRHPERGLVSPKEFVPLLEETGLIVPVGEWVLQTACRDAMEWQSVSGERIRVAVNLSVRQFYASGLADSIQRVLRSTGFPPELLEIEITESITLQHTANSLDIFASIRDLGVRLVLDDFGTGFSSLSYLRRFPVDTIKIDRSFIRDVPADPGDVGLVQAIIAMARTLNLGVVAEGVESSDQLAFLRENHCDTIQGFLFSPAVPQEEIVSLVQRGALVIN